LVSIIELIISFIGFCLAEVQRTRKDLELVSNQGVNLTPRSRREADRSRNEVLITPDTTNLRNQPANREVKENESVLR
jgi:hypothetical protein